MANSKVTLDQWRVLQTVVDFGGFAQAASILHRSQSSISYSMQKLQEQLGVQLLHIIGRKAELTDAGSALLRQSRQLLNTADELEDMAEMINSGWESEIRLVVDAAYPSRDLIDVLKQFEPVSQGTRVQLKEVILSGAEEALLNGTADLAITAFIPPGLLGNLLTEIEFLAVAHPDHPLHQLGRKLTAKDLLQELQVIIADSGARQQRDVGWQSPEHRWRVSKLETAVEAIRQGLGFAWLPAHMIELPLLNGELKALPLTDGQRYQAQFHLVKAHLNHSGPATAKLAELFTLRYKMPSFTQPSELDFV